MTGPLLCETVAASTIESMRDARDAAAAVADLVELRLDALDRPDVGAALAGRRGPVVVTCRPRWEGGSFDGSEEERVALLDEAIRLGADYVDVEWRANAQGLLERRHGKGIVLSTHHFEGVPGDLDGTCRQMIATGAEVVKIAVTAQRLQDNLPLLEVGRRLGTKTRLALVAMGTPGLPSRILASHFGSCWTYAGSGVAPGQIPTSRLLHEFRFREITPATAIYGIAGRPVAHSISPAMHNAAFAASGVDAVFVPLEAESVEDLRLFALGLGLSGASVTSPFKVDIVPYLSHMDGRARQAGAVNTLRVVGDRWEGRNTDVDGFLAPLKERVRLEGLRVALLGSGGAARAVACALAGSGAHLVVHSRNLAAGWEVARLAGGSATSDPPRASSWDLLVNATPIGTWPQSDRTPVEPGSVRGEGVIYDLVYNPAWTRLLQSAREAGCETIGGLDMLVAQAAGQFKWWTGLEAPTALMRARAEARLEEMTEGEGQGAARIPPLTTDN